MPRASDELKNLQYRGTEYNRKVKERNIRRRREEEVERRKAFNMAKTSRNNYYKEYRKKKKAEREAKGFGVDDSGSRILSGDAKKNEWVESKIDDMEAEMYEHKYIDMPIKDNGTMYIMLQHTFGATYDAMPASQKRNIK